MSYSAVSMAVRTVDHWVAYWGSKTAAWKADWMVESLAGLRAACWAGQMAERLACLKVAPKGVQKAGSSVVPMVALKDCMMAVGMADWTAGKTANSTVGQTVVKLVAMSVAEKAAQMAESSVAPMVALKDCKMAAGMADWTAGKTANSTVGQMVVQLVAMLVVEKVA